MSMSMRIKALKAPAVKSTNWKKAEDRARIVCQRLRESRVYNGYTIEEASARFGYKPGDKTQLSLIENAERFPPNWLLFKAVEVYGVPLDYLCGYTDEVEAAAFNAERAAITRRVERIITENATKVATHMTRSLVAGSPAVSMSRALVEQVTVWLKSFERFRVRNAGYTEMPAGSTLEAATAELVRAHDAARHAIERFDNLGKRAIEIEEARLGTTKPLFADAG